MNKYYTPQIEEFHVGFEFETNYILFKNHPGNSWVKIILQTPNHDWFWSEHIADASPLEFRVKYLDKEDIESLGFKHQNNKMLKGYSDNFVYKPNNYLEYNLTYVYKQNILRIDVQDLNYFEESYNYLFQGIIKNKSELKRLLKQLNINV